MVIQISVNKLWRKKKSFLNSLRILFNDPSQFIRIWSKPMRCDAIRSKPLFNMCRKFHVLWLIDDAGIGCSVTPVFIQTIFFSWCIYRKDKPMKKKTKTKRITKQNFCLIVTFTATEPIDHSNRNHRNEIIYYSKIVQ